MSGHHEIKVGDRLWDKDYRVISQFVRVEAIEGEYAILRRGSGRYGRRSRVRLDRLARNFTLLDASWERYDAP